MIIVPGSGWEELLQRLRALKGTALFLGRSDSGKTTLVRYLLRELTAEGLAVALVVAVSAGAELEPILASIPEAETVRLAPAPTVQRRNPGQRIRYRNSRLAAHLHGARELLLATRRLVFLHHAAPVHPVFNPPAAGTVIGLNHEAQTRALGVVTEADAGSLTVLTALPSPRGIDRVMLGDFSYAPDLNPSPPQRGRVDRRGAIAGANHPSSSLQPEVS